MVKILHTYQQLHDALMLKRVTIASKSWAKKSLRGYPKGSFCAATCTSNYGVCTDIKFTATSIILHFYHHPQQGKLL